MVFAGSKGGSDSMTVSIENCHITGNIAEVSVRHSIMMRCMQASGNVQMDSYGICCCGEELLLGSVSDVGRLMLQGHGCVGKAGHTTHCGSRCEIQSEGPPQAVAPHTPGSPSIPAVLHNRHSVAWSLRNPMGVAARP